MTRWHEHEIQLDTVGILGCDPAYNLGPSVHAVHDRVDRGADLCSDRQRECVELGRGNLRVADPDIGIRQFVAAPGAERTAKLEPAQSVVAIHDAAQRIEQTPMPRQSLVQIADRIVHNHSEILARAPGNRPSGSTEPDCSPPPETGQVLPAGARAPPSPAAIGRAAADNRNAGVW